MPTTVRRERSRFVRLVLPFLNAEPRQIALRLGALVALLLTLATFNVVASFVNRDVMTTIAERRTDEFAVMALKWVGVFGLVTVVAVFYRFTEETLALFWRRWMTGWLIGRYLVDRRYYAVNEEREVDNPDQRISEDVRNFTVNTLSLLLILLNSTISLIAFVGVLWSITPWLVLAAILYAAFGTGMTLLVGRRLVRLNNRQFAVEADMRIDLARVRDHSETIAVQGSGPGLVRLLGMRLDHAVRNQRSIIGVNRRLGFFTVSFGYLTQVIPVLIVAPAYFRGEIEFGVVTQSAIAFAQVLGAISLAITNFGQIFALAAVVERLGGLLDALDKPPAIVADRPTVVEEPGRWACEHLTLRVGGNHRPPLQDLTFENLQGKRLLVLGPNGVGKTELFNATAGTTVRGSGRIVRPTGAVFLPLRPYFPPGTIRQLVTDFDNHPADDEAICDLLCRVGFAPAFAGRESLEGSGDWNERLAPSDLQALSVARLLMRPPPWAFLNGVVSAFGPGQRARVYRLFDEAGITYVTFSDDEDRLRFHDRVLRLEGEGKWRMEDLR
jgi:putative ATP-binding cassette transporter